jgi:hypothetical protein
MYQLNPIPNFSVLRTENTWITYEVAYCFTHRHFGTLVKTMKNTNKVMFCFSVHRKTLTFPKLHVKESNPCPKKECKIQKDTYAIILPL